MRDSLSDAMRRIEALIAPGPVSGERTQQLSKVDLRRVCLDVNISVEERKKAIVTLVDRYSIEPDVSECLRILLDDEETELVRQAIEVAPPFAPLVRERIRQLLDDPRPLIWQAAASALARKKDHSGLPLMLQWATRGDREHRRAGLAAIAFLLIPEQHLQVVESICEEGPRDDEDELLLIDALRLAESRVNFWRTNATIRGNDDE